MRFRWLSGLAFGLLALATLGAFFLVQVLKTAHPLIWFSPPPTPVPAAFDPINGKICPNIHGNPLDYRRTQLKLEISHNDTVGVYMVSAKDAFGPHVATVSPGTPMRKSVPGTTEWHPHTFTWNGRLSDGAFAPPGEYYFRIVLQGEDRSINLSEAPVQVMTQPPQARVTSVSMLGQKSVASSPTGQKTAASDAAVQKTAASGPTVLTPGHGTLKISYTPGSYRRLWIDVYRTDVNGPPQFVTQIPADTTGTWARWSGEINKQPLPAGTYLFRLKAQNQACDTGLSPAVMPPAPGTSRGVSIRYLTVNPPLTPTVSGSRATVAVDSPDAGFTWTLRRTGTRKRLEHGSGGSGSSVLRVRMPRRRPGLYTLVVRSGTQSASVPLVASQAGAAASRARVLVVLPMLTWMGNSRVDDTGDGLPDTLTAHDAVALDRPLVDGPPKSLSGDAALLRYLDAQHLHYQLTTDVALAEGRGPSLVDRWGVLFPEGEAFLPAALASKTSGLPEFVRAGGRVLTLGVGTFTGVSRLSGSPAATVAAAPTFGSVDPFGAQRGPITSTDGELITGLSDQLGMFGGGVAIGGFSHYQPIQPPRSSSVSVAGIANQSAAIVGFRYGSGIVMEIGLPQFGATLQSDVSSQLLLSGAWHLLAKQRQ